MRDRLPQTWKVEDWNDYEIRVREDGMFYISDDDGKTAYEAESVEALKRKAAASKPVDIRAVRFGWHSYDGGKKPEIVRVYAITGLGNLMYRSDDGKGPKEKIRKHEYLYTYDDDRLKERARLLAEGQRIEKELKKLMNEWPKVTA